MFDADGPDRIQDLNRTIAVERQLPPNPTDLCRTALPAHRKEGYQHRAQPIAPRDFGGMHIFGTGQKVQHEVLMTTKLFGLRCPRARAGTATEIGDPVADHAESVIGQAQQMQQQEACNLEYLARAAHPGER